MRYQIYNALVATGFLAMTAMDNPVLASPPDGKPFTLAQTQQPATPVPTTPAPAAGAQQQPSGTSPNMPGQMKQRGQEMMGGQGHPGPMDGQKMMGGQGHPGPMGGTPPCPAGQTMSGTPPTCK